MCLNIWFAKIGVYSEHIFTVQCSENVVIVSRVSETVTDQIPTYIDLVEKKYISDSLPNHSIVSFDRTEDFFCQFYCILLSHFFTFQYTWTRKIELSWIVNIAYSNPHTYTNAHNFVCGYYSSRFNRYTHVCSVVNIFPDPCVDMHQDRFYIAQYASTLYIY